MSTNLFKRLKDLLPDPALMVATVAAVHADGTVTVTFPGGGQQRVRGSSAIDQRVFVRAGVVEGDAPSLTAVTIEI